MFRFKRGIDVGYDLQGYIYFYSRMARRLGADAERRVLNLCIKCGGEYYRALWEYVISDRGAVAVCMRHYLSEATLWRMVKKYYEEFADELRSGQE